MIKQKGFTLAELLMVVVILGVLGAIAMPRFFPQTEKAVVAEAVSTLHAIRLAEASFRLENNGNYLPITVADGNLVWNQIGLDDPDSARFTYSVDAVLPGRVWAIRANTANVPADYRGRNVVLFLQDGTWDDVNSDHPLRPRN